MESIETRRKRRAFYLTSAIKELNTVLDHYEYNPDSATTEEQAIVGTVAVLSLILRELNYPRP